MVEGNQPEKAVIDFAKKSYADNLFESIDTNFVLTNGLDWLEFKQTVTKYDDPEEIFQNLCSKMESQSKKMTDDEKTKLREHCKISTLVRNLGSSIRYLAVVDYASASVAQNTKLFFKKGSLVYLLEQRFYYRKSDLLKRE